MRRTAVNEIQVISLIKYVGHNKPSNSNYYYSLENCLFMLSIFLLVCPFSCVLKAAVNTFVYHTCNLPLVGHLPFYFLQGALKLCKLKKNNYKMFFSHICQYLCVKKPISPRWVLLF